MEQDQATEDGRYSLKDYLASLSQDAFNLLPVSDLHDMRTEADEMKAEAKTVDELLSSMLERRYANDAKQQRKGEDTGTATMLREGFEIKVSTPKKVEWDEIGLSTLAGQMLSEGDDPNDYMTITTEITHKVPEKTYQAWDAETKAIFDRFRTVKPGKTSISITPAKDA